MEEQLKADICERLDEWSLLPGTTHEEDCDFWGCDDGQGLEFCNCSYRREVDAWAKCLVDIEATIKTSLLAMKAEQTKKMKQLVDDAFEYETDFWTEVFDNEIQLLTNPTEEA